jgi:hypothetical protein
VDVLNADILIVGGGSAGFGTAIQAARTNPDARIVLLEGTGELGGTSTIGGVNNWEPGVGGLGVHYELYERMAATPGQIGVGATTHFYTPDEPWGLSTIDPDCPYEASLRRSATPRADWRRVHFEPYSLSAMMRTMLEDAGVQVRLNTRCTGVQVSGRQVVAITAEAADGAAYEVQARLFVDCTGGNYLARAAECEMAFGEEAYAQYEEPSAPDEPSTTVNGISQIFRVTPVAGAAVEPLPPEALADDVQQWLAENNPATAITEYPNGDLCMNVLPTMQGEAFHARPYAESKRICEARMFAHWHRMQTRYGFDRYRFVHMFPLVGIRESHRLVGRYVLREQDARAGLLKQDRQAELIAFSDHAADTHGRSNIRGPKLAEMEQPYGIPYACLLPKEYDNLMVASRGASFSHIGASTCRLSRTMMALGEAAGVASGIASRDGLSYPDVPVAEIRTRLRIPEFIDKVIREWQLERPPAAEQP